MEKKGTVALLDHFANLPDPRIECHRWHKLSDILVIAVCAVLCGAERYPAIEDFGHEREEGLRQFLEWPAGVPSHDTFNRVLRLLDPEKFQACFLSWRQAVTAVTQGEVVAIDGKALRRSFATGTAKRAIHMVSAWATENGVGLGSHSRSGRKRLRRGRESATICVRSKPERALSVGVSGSEELERSDDPIFVLP